MSTCQERRVSYTWRVGETVNSHAFHACIHGFESRTGHQKVYKSPINGLFFVFNDIIIKVVNIRKVIKWLELILI